MPPGATDPSEGPDGLPDEVLVDRIQAGGGLVNSAAVRDSVPASSSARWIRARMTWRRFCSRGCSIQS
jgi:hypothetical protein